MYEKRLRRKSSSSPAGQTALEEKMSFLAHINIFRDLNIEEIRELDRMTAASIHPPGRIFYRPGDAATMLFFVKSGRVQTYHLSTDGRKLITATIDSGAYFGEISLLGQQQHTSFAESIEQTQIYTINKIDIEQLFIQKPEITYALLEVFGRRLATLESQLIDTTFKTTTARLAELLLQLAQPATQEITLVVNGFSHEELADHLGVYRETVSAALRDLKDAGTIELARKHITINEPARLKNLAKAMGKVGTHYREWE